MEKHEIQKIVEIGNFKYKLQISLINEYVRIHVCQTKHQHYSGNTDIYSHLFTVDFGAIFCDDEIFPFNLRQPLKTIITQQRIQKILKEKINS